MERSEEGGRWESALLFKICNQNLYIISVNSPLSAVQYLSCSMEPLFYFYFVYLLPIASVLSVWFHVQILLYCASKLKLLVTWIFVLDKLCTYSQFLFNLRSPLKWKKKKKSVLDGPAEWTQLTYNQSESLSAWFKLQFVLTWESPVYIPAGQLKEALLQNPAGRCCWGPVLSVQRSEGRELRPELRSNSLTVRSDSAYATVNVNYFVHKNNYLQVLLSNAFNKYSTVNILVNISTWVSPVYSVDSAVRRRGASLLNLPGCCYSSPGVSVWMSGQWELRQKPRNFFHSGHNH